MRPLKPYALALLVPLALPLAACGDGADSAATGAVEGDPPVVVEPADPVVVDPAAPAPTDGTPPQ